MAHQARGSQRDKMVQEIKAIARQQMAVGGAASLSLGAIARAMGLSTPALYRYFGSRDALVTELILDSYDALSDDCARAVEGLEQASPGERFHALVHAYRRWALGRPQDYVLVHGAVFPGYRAPVDQVGARALRVLQLVTALLSDARDAGALTIPEPYRSPPPGVQAVAELLLGGRVDTLPVTLVTIAWLVWVQVHALVWQEIAGHLPPEIFEDGLLFEQHMELIAQQLGVGRARATT